MKRTRKAGISESTRCKRCHFCSKRMGGQPNQLSITELVNHFCRFELNRTYWDELNCTLQNDMASGGVSSPWWSIAMTPISLASGVKSAIYGLFLTDPKEKKKEEEEDMKRKQWNERKREMKRGSYLCIHLAPWIWCSGTSSLDEMEIATVSERYGRRRGEKPRWEGIEREREGRREGEWESWNRFMEGSGWRERLPGLYRRETSNYFDAAVGGPPSFLPHLSFFFFSPKNNH